MYLTVTYNNNSNVGNTIRYKISGEFVLHIHQYERQNRDLLISIPIKIITVGITKTFYCVLLNNYVPYMYLRKKNFIKKDISKRKMIIKVSVFCEFFWLVLDAGFQ